MESDGVCRFRSSSNIVCRAHLFLDKTGPLTGIGVRGGELWVASKGCVVISRDIGGTR